MGTLLFAIVLASAIAWPSVLISRLFAHGGYLRLAWYMVGPISAFAGGALGYLLFQFLLRSPSAPKDLETFLVNQSAVGFLAACVVPWAAYFGLKAYRRRLSNGAH
jgi:hypothetical protein